MTTRYGEMRDELSMADVQRTMIRTVNLYLSYYFALTKEELFLSACNRLSLLETIERQSLNVLSHECYQLLHTTTPGGMGSDMNTFQLSKNESSEELAALLDEEITKLTPLHFEPVTDAQPLATKEDLQQFKRFAYKNFQTIQDLIGEQATAPAIREEVERLQAEATDELFSMAKNAVEVFNLFDRVKLILSDKHPEIADQLEAVIVHSLETLKDMGIVEIPVYGEEFNGDYMDSLGTVTLDEIKDKSLKLYEVAVVFRRAFHFKGNQKIIQDALVKTIL